MTLLFPFARPVAGRGPARARPQTGPGSLTCETWETPTVEEIRMDAEIGAYQADDAPPDEPIVDSDSGTQ